MSTIALICALSRNRVIGLQNDLPWHLPDDFAFFKQKTMGQPMIMGRKTFEALGKPLPGRMHYVITGSDWQYAHDRVQVLKSLPAAIEAAKQNTDGEVFIIGGGQVFEQSLQLADTLYLTEIDAIIDGDAYFPEVASSIFEETERIHHPADERHAFAFDFVTYRRKA